MKTWTKVWINLGCLLTAAFIATLAKIFCEGLLFGFATLGITWLLWNIIFLFGNSCDEKVVIVIHHNDEEKENEENENENNA